MSDAQLEMVAGGKGLPGGKPVAGGAASNLSGQAALTAMGKQAQSKSALSTTFHNLMRNIMDAWPRR